MHGSRPVILFIDDSVEFLEGVKRSMRSEALVTLTASSVDSALTVLEVEAVDVVVCDERFPDRSGWELLSEIRRIYPRIVRIMLTGAASMASTVASINHGQVFRFLLKPCSHESLMEALQSAIEHRRLHDNLRKALSYLVRVNEAISEAHRRHPDACAQARAGISLLQTTEVAVTETTIGLRMEHVLEGLRHTLGDQPSSDQT